MTEGEPKISAALLNPPETIHRNGNRKGIAATDSASVQQTRLITRVWCRVRAFLHVGSICIPGDF